MTPTLSVHRFTLDEDITTLSMGADAKPLSIQYQKGILTMWALVNLESPKVSRAFKIYGTGHPIETAVPKMYIGTVQEPGSSFVWHIFELDPPNPFHSISGEPA